MKHAKTPSLIVLCLVLELVLCSYGLARPSDDLFPIPEQISSNVDFWTRVYASYTTSQGIIHDNLDLSIIYEVIELKAYDAPGATGINRNRIKQANEKYRGILLELANDPNATSKEGRRMAALFNHSQDRRLFRQAADRIRCQVGQKDRFISGLIRSGAYLDQIHEILRSHGLPEDLAYLPHVESSFNPKAYSKFGAAGMWQFTRSTGSRFMEVGYALDERRDPILATYAAAQLLKENFEKLGTWPLAITAYNHGSAGMERAKQAHGDDYATIFANYRGPSFKFASRNFYSEFLAARNVATDYRRHFGELTLDQPATAHNVVLDGYLAFKDACRHFDVDSMLLQKLNPALREPVLEGQKHIPKGYALRLPDAGSGRPAGLMAAIPAALYQNSQMPSRFYTVQHNDTAGKIARIHAVDLNDLILANNLDRRATIFARQTLRIPLPGETVVAQAKPGKEVAQVEPVNKLSDQSLVAALKQEAVQPLPESKLENGEGIYPQPVLASVIPFTSKTDNAISANKEQTTLAVRTELNSEVVMAEVGFFNLFESNGRSMGTIHVEVEETLGHYAEWAGVRTQQIRYLNDLSFGSVLQLHQKVKIPLYRTTAQAFEQNRYEFHKRLQEDFFSVYRISEVRPYQVKAGDNYWALCRQNFEIPLWLLKHYNPEVDLADLKVGRKLVIPEIDKADPDDASAPPMEEEM